MTLGKLFTNCKHRHFINTLLFCWLVGGLCVFTELTYGSNIQKRRMPLPTKESLPYVAEELGAATYIESNDDNDEDTDDANHQTQANINKTYGITVKSSQIRTVTVSEPSVKQHPPNRRQNRTNGSSSIPFKRLPRKLATEYEQSDNNLDYKDYYGVFGRAGVDFPVLATIPVTKFSCKQVKHSNAGYYADLETNCQVFHVCDTGRKISFLCPNGTIFRQSHLICDWWFRVDCERSPELYDESAEHLAADQLIYKQRAEAIAKAMQKALDDKQNTSSPSSYSEKYENNFNSETGLPKRPQYNQNTTSSSTENYQNFNNPPHSSSENYQNFKEQQILAESASFTGNNGKLTSINNNYYYFDYTHNNANSAGIKNDNSPFIEKANQYSDPNSVTNSISDTSTPGGLINYYTTVSPIIDYPTVTNNNIPQDHRFGIKGPPKYPDDSSSEIEKNINDTIAVYFTSTPNNGLYQNNYLPSTAPPESSRIIDNNNFTSSPSISDLVLTVNSAEQSGEFVTTTTGQPTITGLLTKMTKDGYNKLFSASKDVTTETSRQISTVDYTNIQEYTKSDLRGEHTLGLVQSNDEKRKNQKEELISKLKFNNSPDLRELAQVFSRALSAYLEDPEQFRRVLSEVRPTEPSLSLNSSQLVNNNDEVLTFSEDKGNQNYQNNFDESSSYYGSATEQNILTTIYQNPQESNNSYFLNTDSSYYQQTTTVDPEVLKNPLIFAKEVNNIMANGNNNFENYFTDNSAENHNIFQNTNISASAESSSEFLTTTNNPTDNTFIPSESFYTQKYSDYNTIISSSSSNRPTYDDNFSPSVGEQLLLTADTQSFVSRDNLLKYQYDDVSKNNIDNNKNNYYYSQNTSPTEYPEYSSASFASETQTIIPYTSSDDNVSKNNNYKSSSNQPLLITTDYYSSSTYLPYFGNQNINNNYSIPITTTNLPNLITDYFSHNKVPEYGEKININEKEYSSSTQELMNVMKQARTNNTLKRQLVLLLVSDKNRKENKSIRDMKEKLLKALLKTGGEENNTLADDNNYNQNNYNNQNYFNNSTDSENNKNSITNVNKDYNNLKREIYANEQKNVVINRGRIKQRNGPSIKSVKSSFIINNVSNKVPSSVTTNTGSGSGTGSRFVKSTKISKESDTKIDQSSTVIVPVPAALKSEPKVFESDNRAVDLLKSLYALATNWNR